LAAWYNSKFVQQPVAVRTKSSTVCFTAALLASLQRLAFAPFLCSWLNLFAIDCCKLHLLASDYALAQRCMTLQHSLHVAHVHLLSCCAGFECNMAEWHTVLDQLDIPDGAVAGLSASHKPVLRGYLLQLPAADRPYFFVGEPLDVLKTLRTLLPEAPSGQAQLFSTGFTAWPVAAFLCIVRATLVCPSGSQQQMSILQQTILPCCIMV